jgi:hypothetical protein
MRAAIRRFQETVNPFGVHTTEHNLTFLPQSNLDEIVPYSLDETVTQFLTKIGEGNIIQVIHDRQNWYVTGDAPKSAVPYTTTLVTVYYWKA